MSQLISESYRNVLIETRNQEIKKNGAWGSSARMLSQEILENIEKKSIRTILDYGAGTGSLGKHLPEKYTVTNYDPGIVKIAHNNSPKDFVACIDVLEHIEPEFLENVLDDLQRCMLKSGYFVISCREAKKILANGENAHLIVKSREWWKEKLEKRFILKEEIWDDSDKSYKVYLEPQKTEKTRGYVVVASRVNFFYHSACLLLETIKDFDPEAKVCLVTEERFTADGRADFVDDLIFCDDHERAKIYGMAKSPYDLTFYIDADCVIEHEDILKVFDEIGDNDLMFTCCHPDRAYSFTEVDFPGGSLWLNGGVCLYDMSKPIVREFINDWYNLTVDQYAHRWWPQKEDGTPDYDLYPNSLRRWDQFSLWWLTNKNPKYCDGKLKVEVFENDARWNYYHRYRDWLDHTNGTPVVIRHFSSSSAKKKDYT
jgi:hypothetical protein